MRKVSLFLIVSAAILSLTISCKKVDDTKKVITPVVASKTFIVNYGSYSGSKGELSSYDESGNVISNNAYSTANGLAFNSNIQSVNAYKDKIYIMSNNADKIDILDIKTLEQDGNPITTDIVKPRYCVFKDNKAYVSCWGNITDWNANPITTSYIAVIDLTSRTVTKKIVVNDGPEGLAIVGNKLYAALEYDKKIVVIDLASETITKTITTKGATQQLRVDASKNLWVSTVSNYSETTGADSVGISIVNTQTDAISSFINVTGIGADGYVEWNKDSTKLYVMGQESWPGTKSQIIEVNAATKSVSNAKLIEGENYYGLGYNKATDKIYVLISPSATANGTLKVYSSSATFEKEATTGIAPQQVLFCSYAE